MPLQKTVGGGDTRVWWYQGKAYLSYSAYQAAVQAAAEAARQQAAAQAEAQQRAEVQQRELQRQAAVRQQALREQAALEAARRAAARRAALLRAQSAERAAYLRAKATALAKARERQVLLEKQAAQQNQIRQQQIKRQREIAQNVEAQRQSAYNELAARERAIWFQYRRTGMLTQQEETREQRLREGLRVRYSNRIMGGFQEGAEGFRVIHGATREQRRRGRALEKAQRTGNWKDALDLLDTQSRETGGRYVDPVLMQAITQGLVNPVVTLGNAYDKKIGEINKWLDRDDIEKAFNIWEDPDFARLRREFIKWYGNPEKGTTGRFAAIADTLNTVAERQERVWLRQMAGLPPQASDAEVAEIFRKGREAAPQDMRGGFREFVAENPRMDLYLTMLEGQEKHRIQQARLEMQNIIKRSRQEGYEVVTEDGVMKFIRPEDQAALAKAKTLMPNAAARLMAIEAAGENNPALREQLVRQFMGDLGSAFDRLKDTEYADYLASVRRSVPGVPTIRPGVAQAGAATTAFAQLKTEFLDSVSGAAFGRSWSGWDQASTTGPGAVLQGAFTIFSTASAAVRYAFQQRSGNYSPYLDLALWGDKTKGDGTKETAGAVFEFGRVLDENADEARKMFEQAFESGDLGAIGEAIRQYSQWGEGNLGGLLTQMVDPLQFAGLGGVTRGARLAAASRLTGAGRVPMMRRLLTDFYRFSAPRRLLRGAGRDEVMTQWARLKTATKLGIPYKEVMHESDDVWRELFEKAVRGEDELNLSDDLQRFLGKSRTLDQGQLMSEVQRVVKEVAKEYGLAPASSLRVHKLMRAAQEGYQRAVRQLDEAKAKAKALADEEAAIRTLQDVRKIAGTPLTERVISATARSNYSKYFATAVKASQEYFAIADRARLLSESIETLGRAAKTDYKLLHENFAELRSTLKQMRQYETRTTINPLATKKRGLVDKYWSDLRRHEEAAGWRYSAITADDVIKRGWQGIRQDRRWMKARERGLRTAIAQNKDPQKAQFLQRQLDEVMQARVGLEFEASLLDEGRAMARQASNRFEAQIAKGVRPQQLGSLATNSTQRTVETVRNLNAKWSRVTRTEAPPRLPKGVKAIAEDVIAEAGSINVAEMIRKYGFDWGDNVSLLDAAVALQSVMADDALKLTYGPLWRSVRRELANTMWSKGWKRSFGGGSIFFVDEVLSKRHIRNGLPVYDLKQFRTLDRTVADALFDLRGRRASGQIRRAGHNRARFTGEWRPSRFDLDPEWRLEKIRALRQHGVSLHAYDDARSMLGDVLLKRRRMAKLLFDARKISRSTGEAVDDVFLRLRDQAALQESKREFVEWAMRPEMRGMTPEQVLRTFEEDYIGRDLGFAPDLVLNPYQKATLRAAFEAESGFSPEDTHLLKRFFLGQMGELAPGARRPNPGEFAAIEGAEELATRTNVVPLGHYKLTNPPRWARPRGLDEADEIRRGWDDNLQKITPSDRLDPTGENVMERIDDLEAALSGEISEQQAARRGADTGRRSTAAAEARRSTRRNFAEAPIDEYPEPGFAQTYNRFLGPEGLSVEDYRKWLWNEVQTSDSFREALRRSKAIPSGGSSAKAQVMRDAKQWLWSAEGKQRFAVRRHAARPHRRGVSVNEREWKNSLLEEQQKLSDLRVELRKILGGETDVVVNRKWLDELEAELNRRADIQGFYHATGDRKSIANALEIIRGGGPGSAHPVGLRAQYKAGRGIRLPYKQAKQLEAILEETNAPSARAGVRFGAEGKKLVKMEGVAPRESIDSLIERGRATFLETEFTEVTDLTQQRRLRQLGRVDDRLKEINEELKAGWSSDRKRGNVGLSVADDGIYVAEGTGNVTFGHEVFHQFWDDPGNSIWKREIEHVVDNVIPPHIRSSLWQAIRVNKSGYDPAEFTAELYGLYKAGDNLNENVAHTWDDLVQGLGADRVYLDELARTFDQYQPKIAALVPPDVRVPPIWNRTKLRNWLVDQGYWSPRTGEAIANGERVWSIDEERAFFQSNWAFDPPWTDPTVLRPLLNDHQALRAALRSWGFADDGFEELVARDGLTPKQVQQQLAWGGQDIARARTLDEMRRYARERYGDLVYQNGRMIRMPWLMTADDEYLSWLGTNLDAVGKEAYRQRREAEWGAARDRLPAPVRDAYFDHDVLRRAGLELDRGMLKEGEITALTEAIKKATRRRLDRMKSAGDVEPGTWLPQEQMRFAYDVVNELMLDRSWRGLLRGNPVGGVAAHAWGQFFRMLVSLNIAFPVMNLLDSFGWKRLYLQVYQNGFAPLGWDRDGQTLVRGLREVGAESTSVFHLQHGPQNFTDLFTRVGDRNLSLNQRTRIFAGGSLQSPVLISKWGEDRLRLQFAQSVAGKAYRGAKRTGMDDEAAKWLARAEAKRMVETFFATAPNSGWRQTLDELVPFFNYNWRNKTLAVRTMWEHPSVWMWGERIRREIEKQNREMWAELHPDLPFPDGPSAGWLWFEADGEIYQIDLTAFSDWTRALKSVSGDQTALEWFSEFVRIPHPSQQAMMAALFGGMTPWGRPGHIRELNGWVDLLFWLNGQDYENPDWKRDALQMGSQMMFFKKFGKITTERIKQMTYFTIRDRDPEAARLYLENNPDLKAYWAAKASALGKLGQSIDSSDGISRFETLTQEEKDLFSASMDEFNRLMDRMDAEIAKYANQPWSDEYKAAKKKAYAARLLFFAQHPEIPDFFAIHMSPAEFAAYYERWKVDDELEAFFAMERPDSQDYKSEMAYQKALLKYYQDREAYLDAHPSAMQALYGGRTSIERAWHEQELQWSEILEGQARIKIAILKEEAKGAKADRDLIDGLYDLRSDFGLALDANRYEPFQGAVRWGTPEAMADARALLNQQIRAAGGTPVSRIGEIPGFRQYLYQRATPEKRREMDRDRKYFQGISSVVERATDGASFYELLKKDPWLLREYWKRNPDKKAEYEAGQEYFRWISTWVGFLKNDDFNGAQRVWDQMPEWVHQRYFTNNPDSKMRDGMGGTTGGSVQSVQYGGQFFSSPESRQRFIEGQQYYAALGGWIELLEKKQYDKADDYFRSLPSWMKEKYWDKHPDQRARMELDSSLLGKGAEYFLAKGEDKLKILQRYPELRQWLNEHGGDEAAHRGLIQAMYAAIPSSEAWLKRTFRERFPEIFSQEAAGERRFESVARDLAEHPEVLPFYEKAVKLQYAMWIEQMKLNKTPPKPWVLERKRRAKKASKRRAARFHSLWSLYRETRRQTYVNMGRDRNRP